MKISGVLHMSFIFISVTVLFSNINSQYCTDAAEDKSSTQRRPYIIHVEENLTMSHQKWHESFLPSTSSSQGLMFSYKHAMSGFAAMLTEDEVEAVSKKDGFLHAHPSENYKLSTTHSPSFLGLIKPPVVGSNNQNNIWRDTFDYGKGIIIGVLDSGFTPNHPSFDDHRDMPPPPKKWKGKCQAPIVCNNKIIGAKSFIFNLDGSRVSSPVDEDGHGTHTASTAAGQFVDNANVLGSANGTASGVAPGAHLAIYKVCGSSAYCAGVSILAGMESAIKDGVDVLSISLGSSEGALYMDPISIASFKLVNYKGVFVSASAGNEGPKISTLVNASPWIFTVGASTIDRKILAVVKLSNGVKFLGESAYQPKNFTPSPSFPLLFPQSEKDENSTYCSNVTTLRSIGVSGKVVICNVGIVNRIQQGLNVADAGGVAMINIGSVDDGFTTFAASDEIPTSGINYQDGQKILNHYYENPNLTVTIEFLGTQIRGDDPAPAVASFSSRGPSKVTPGFIKPDVIGPGVNIIAAWVNPNGNSHNVSPTYKIESGTSMSCPHLSGVAALLKKAHPDWSPAMIKSAIITTSDVTNTNGNRITDQYDKTSANFHVMGSGHVNLIKANNPGLIYDTQFTNDYVVAYLCGLNYTDNQVSIFVPHSKCSTSQINGVDLNYPSMVVQLSRSNYYRRRFSRLVTNVGPNLEYKVIVNPPPGVIVDVEPKKLKFTSIGEQLKFNVDVYLDANSPEFSEGFGYFSWVSSDEKINVRSPMVITKEIISV